MTYFFEIAHKILVLAAILVVFPVFGRDIGRGVYKCPKYTQ